MRLKEDNEAVFELQKSKAIPNGYNSAGNGSSPHFTQEAKVQTKSIIGNSSQGTPRPGRGNSVPQNRMRVSIDTLRRNQEIMNTKQKCQVDPSCQEIAINICSEQAYRGCTMAYCNNHSGKLNRLQRSSCLCKFCLTDKHIDICSECSNDILSARRKFYCISTILTLLVFIVLLCLLHVILQAIPGICPADHSTSPSSICTTFHNFWHAISIYDREAGKEDRSFYTGQDEVANAPQNEDLDSYDFDNLYD